MIVDFQSIAEESSHPSKLYINTEYLEYEYGGPEELQFEVLSNDKIWKICLGLMCGSLFFAVLFFTMGTTICCCCRRKKFITLNYGEL